MCTPSAPKAAPVVTPPPPAQLAKPLGVDDDLGLSGIAALRSGGRNGLAIRPATGVAPSPSLSLSSGSGGAAGSAGGRTVSIPTPVTNG